MVKWFCVHLYSKLVLCKLVQYIGFVYTCTVSLLCIYLWFCVQLYESNSRSAKGSVLSVYVYVGTHFVQSWHSDCTKQLAIYQQLVSIKIKFNQSSSQESFKCFLILHLTLKIRTKMKRRKVLPVWLPWLYWAPGAVATLISILTQLLLEL